jgi:DNA-binding response OmpR family regulator
MELRVLVVCPDQDAAKLLTRVLSEMGIEPEHTPSITKGLERVEQQHYDAIILDYHSDQSSQDFVSKLRLSAENRNSLLVAIVDSELSARPVFGLGANFVLYRPLSLERTKLSLRAARGLMRRERRRAPRIPVSAPASFDHSDAQDQRGTILDLSDGGTSVQSDRRMPLSCKVYFQFNLPGQEQLIRLSGEVAWQDSSGRSGIRFLNVPQSSKKLIHAWLLQNNFKARTAAGKVLAPENAEEPKTAAGRAPNAGNRRGERRVACKLGAEVYRLGMSVPNRCALSDVSEGGCYVEMPTPFTAQTGVEIVVRTKDMKLKIRGQVQAVHPGFGMGVRFMFKDSGEREEILRLLGVLAAGPTLDELPR